ncbi:hypothetical protein LOTGIDRAFT_173485 [Lottia gigantea]|uniref:Uncharacterized protein n=1 Tax=Lottia gigantea TaxID=225164 RepID=V4ARG8_LOTGI|nr:hypothetical protein LOTGIDRAFT_173485 [Lottia gigantea]ESO99827.1 hypothetical protein LOTGIDRAFT_173485 [Lottia gigantea]
MTLILKHEQERFNGDGFISALTSLFPKVASFVANNKSLISSEAQAIGSIAKSEIYKNHYALFLVFHGQNILEKNICRELETIKHPGEFDTTRKTVLYPKDFDSVSSWIPDLGDGSVLKEPVRNVANDADQARMRLIDRNTIERVGRAANHGFEKRVLQYNNTVDSNSWGSYVVEDVEIAFLRRNTVLSVTLTGESTTWPITNTIKPARYLMVGFENLPDSQTNNNNVFRVAMNQNQDPIIHKVQVR